MQKIPNEYNYLKIDERNLAQKFRLKNIDEKRFDRNYSIREIGENELLIKKYKIVSRDLNHMGLALVCTECVFVSAFASLVGTPKEITNSTIVLKICTVTPGIKKHNSKIRKAEKI